MVRESCHNISKHHWDYGIIYFLKCNNFHHKLSFIWILWGSVTQSSSNLLCLDGWSLPCLKSSKTSKSQSSGELWRDVLSNDLGLLRDSGWIISCSLVIKHTPLTRPRSCSCWQYIQSVQRLILWVSREQLVKKKKKVGLFIRKWVFNECVERVDLWVAAP